VQIEKKLNPSTLLASVATRCAMEPACEYAAIFPTRLALARWTRGGDIPHIPMFAHHAPTRGAWYEQAQDGFQAWLDAGGFHQSELEDIGSAIGTDALPTP
jgi:hypothetical protein